MKLVLGIWALVFFVCYAFYSWKIWREQAGNWEQEMIDALAAWMAEQGSASRMTLWMMLGVAIVLASVYFILVLNVLHNPALQILTVVLMGMELYHYGTAILRFYSFGGGKITIMQLFDWKIERICALSYTVHTFLVLTCLIFVL